MAKWIETEPQEIHKTLNYPNIGPRESYLLYHEELESLVANFPTIKRARFWMTFGQEYLTHLRVIQDIGMASIEPIMYEGRRNRSIAILEGCFAKSQGTLGLIIMEETSIGCRIRGIDKEGKPLTYYIYNNCSHEDAYKETGMQAVSYTDRCTCHDGGNDVLERLVEQAGRAQR